MRRVFGMRIAQYRQGDEIRIGLIGEGGLQPVDFRGDLIDYLRQRVELRPAGAPLPLGQVLWAPAVSRPSKIVAIGLNYRDHADESGGRPPERPLLFAKFPNSVAAHGEAVTWDTSLTEKVDYEAELAVVIGRRSRNLGVGDALAAVFGYTCANDVSARDLQFGDRQWVRGKSLDSFCPLGPWIVTADAFTEPLDVEITCRVNGRLMQSSRTSRMIFKVPELVSFLSRNFTLQPGDVILTGTPSGVGAFRDPPVYLQSGDEVSVTIEGIGTLTNPCRTV
ncbi:fumarylacetoacetate hydrolase family protein [Desulfatiglans anilini]|uniref:fumarylacetoacetate hydrolase family protein n=1 Tax=Desulfatiglans anilini TaxID=90728 RepID=UPI000688314F|nr:fumarylacetoacetate hydrolase family protein [Desulfatiglans anilini]